MLMDNSNVIKFPKPNKMIKEIDHEEMSNNLTSMKFNHINETLSVVIPILFNNLDIAGFTFDNVEDEFDLNSMKDGALIVESIRSIMCKHYNLFHPFQTLSQGIFESDDTVDEELKIVEELCVDLRNNTGQLE